MDQSGAEIGSGAGVVKCDRAGGRGAVSGLKWPH